MRLPSARCRGSFSARGQASVGARGQATVEMVALLPLAVLVALAAFHVLAAGRAAEAAGAAAEAGAVAMLQDRDPGAAVRAALAGWPRAAVRFRVSGRRVTVTVRPRALRPLARRLTASATAYAGAPPPSRVAETTTRGGDGARGAER